MRSLGKPDPAIYGPVLDLLDLPRAACWRSGDALRTDIAGAAAIGVASCWVLGGLHGEALDAGPHAARDAVRAAGLAPIACIPGFAW